MPRVPKNSVVKNTPPPEQGNRAIPVIIVLSVLLLMAVSVAGYFYYQYRKTPEIANAKELKELQTTIGKIMILPTEEEPTLATVADKEKLADQPFFQKAENGDKVLIYTNSGRAILYRPSLDRIVDVTSVNVKAPEVPVAPATTPTENALAPTTPPTDTSIPAVVRIALYNGSTKIGVTNTLESEIKTRFPDVTITAKDKATKTDYQGTIVVDLSGKNSELAQKLAGSFGGTVSVLPEGETAPASDILVIIGNK
jgi:hypothetical protein